MVPEPTTAGDRRITRRTVIPLTVVAGAFFLPAYRGCRDSGFQAPLEYADSFSGAAIIGAVFLAAGILALLSARALLRGEMDPRTRRMGLLTVLGLVLSDLVMAPIFVATGGSRDWLFAVPAGIGALSALLAIRRARGQPPWKEWDCLLFAFGLAAAGTFPSAFLTLTLIAGPREDLAYGAYVFVAAQLATLASTLPAVVRDRSGGPLRRSAPDGVDRTP